MNNVLRILISVLILLAVGFYPVIPQENKDIKMDIFEKEGKVLPFSAVKTGNRAVTNLEKKDLVLLLNGRNFRDFTLVYPSTRGNVPGTANAPGQSGYDIIFPYIPELYATMSIQLGTTRPGVRLQTLDTLKINLPGENTAAPGETAAAEPGKTATKIIPVKIIEVDSQGHRIDSTSPAGQSKISTAKVEEKSSLPQPPVSLPDTKAAVLKDVKQFQLGLVDKASRNFCEAAMQFLKQNRVNEALLFFAKMCEREGIEPGQEVSRLPLLDKLKRTDRAMDRMLADVMKLSKKRKSTVDAGTWDNIDSLVEKGKIKKALSAMQEVLNNYRVPVYVVREALDRLPVILEVHRYPPFEVEKSNAIYSPAQQLSYCRERLDLFRSSLEQLESQVFVNPGRTRQILTQLEQFLSTGTGQIERISLRLADIREIEKQKYAREVMEFVIANSTQFPSEFKNPFFKEKLAELGVPVELREQPSFFDVLTQARGIKKNVKGYWEIVFSDGITMVYIPAGEFVMGVAWESGGAEDESPRHNVFLDGCWISKHEITFAQYDRFCRETARGEIYDYGRGRKHLPVIGVAWQDCQDYSQWLSMVTGVQFRLPTEAEWEKAARGTKPGKYPWGNHKADGNLTNFADVKFLKKYLELNPPLNEEDRKQRTDWIDPSIDDGYVFTAPVGSFPKGASPYGVMDMAGNVWEWVLDWYDDDYYQRSPSRNPQKVSAGSYRVARGGGWDCHPWLLRSTGRAGCDPNLGNDALGFRVVCYNATAVQE